MRHLLLETGAVGACALAFVVAHGPAQAVSPLALEEAAPLVILAETEDEAVEEDMLPDEMAPGEGEDADMGMSPPPEDSEESTDIENEMIDKIGPGAE